MKKFTARILPINEVLRLADADIEEIDKITDSLVKKGICRPRTDTSLFPRTACATRLDNYLAKVNHK